MHFELWLLCAELEPDDAQLEIARQLTIEQFHIYVEIQVGWCFVEGTGQNEWGVLCPSSIADPYTAG